MYVIKKENNNDLLSIFGITSGDKIAIIGCGGKTSLMYALAAVCRGGTVLMTTTTRILRPPAHVYGCEISGRIRDVKNGVHLFYGSEKNGKLFSPAPDELTRAQTLFDYVFIEADGSKMRALKGWAEYEPVIPDFVTATIAVAAVSPVGDVISEKNTHRLPVFSRITGTSEGETVTAAHIAAMISHPHGMLRKAAGKRILFINQVKSENDRGHALDIISCLPKAFLKSLSRVIIGSVRQNTYEIIEKRDERDVYRYDDPKHS